MELLSFSEFTRMKLYEDVQELQEKLVVFNNQAKYGQVVFGSGGSRSGKGFSIDKFIDSSSYKVIDVDKFKTDLQKYYKKTGKNPEIANMDMHDERNTGKLHQFVKEKGIVDRYINNILNASEVGKLPNLFFDITGKKIGDFEDYIPRLIEVGYDKDNMHLVWILTKYTEAVANNEAQKTAPNGRAVPPEIVLSTHEGAGSTMERALRTEKLPMGINGEFVIINNNKENTVKSASGHIVDFKRYIIKKAGQTGFDKTKLNDIYTDIVQNIPKTGNTGHIFSVAKKLGIQS